MRNRSRMLMGMLALGVLAGIVYLVVSGTGPVPSGRSGSPPAPAAVPAPGTGPIVTIRPLEPLPGPPPARRQAGNPTPSAADLSAGDEAGALSETEKPPPARRETSDPTPVSPHPDREPAAQALQAALSAIDAQYGARVAAAQQTYEATRERNDRRIAAARAALPPGDESPPDALAEYEEARTAIARLDQRSRGQWEPLKIRAQQRIDEARADYDDARADGRRGERAWERYQRVRRSEEKIIEAAEARLQRELGEHQRLLEEAEQTFHARKQSADAGRRRAAELSARIAQWEAETERAADRVRRLEAERDAKKAEARRD